MCKAGRWIAIHERNTVIPDSLISKALSISEMKVKTMIKHTPMGKHLVIGSDDYDELVLRHTVQMLVDKGYTFLLNDGLGTREPVYGVPIPDLKARYHTMKGGKTQE